MEIARKVGADAVSHGATGKGNDQVRFELTYAALAPDLDVIAPWRTWDIRSREDAIDYAQKHDIPIEATKEKIYSRDRNLWHLSHEGGELEDPWTAPNEEMYVISTSPKDAPDQAQLVEIDFKQGVPVSVDGERLGAVNLLEKLNQIGGKHGVGRVDMVENRLVGMKSRGAYETPGGAILYAAHRELESLILDRDTLHYKDSVALRYAELVYYGQWFTPLRQALDAFVETTQVNVSGTVRLELYKGQATPAGVKSPYSLYSEEFATFGEDDVYDQSHAEGFIRLFGLPMRVAAIRDIKNSGS